MESVPALYRTSGGFDLHHPLSIELTRVCNDGSFDNVSCWRYLFRSSRWEVYSKWQRGLLTVQVLVNFCVGS